ncbi:MAG: hypothetical protein GC199_07160 [Alphaproteobacteria bacterium]|nr:hypothetical protein [Alphaproteobacteria bacterium]
MSDDQSSAAGALTERSGDVTAQASRFAPRARAVFDRLAGQSEGGITVNTRLLALLAVGLLVAAIAVSVMMQLRRDYAGALDRAETDIRRETILLSQLLGAGGSREAMEATLSDLAARDGAANGYMAMRRDGTFAFGTPVSDALLSALAIQPSSWLTSETPRLRYLTVSGGAEFLASTQAIPNSEFGIVLVRPLGPILSAWSQSLPTYALLVLGPAICVALLVMLVVRESEDARVTRSRLRRKEQRFEDAFVTLSVRAAETEQRLRASLSATESALVLAEERAQTAERVRSDLLAGASHELRTPLNAILGFSEVMASGALGSTGNPKYVEYARDIHASGRQLLYLVDELLAMASINRGEMRMSLDELAVEQLLHECAALVRPLADERQIRIVGKVGHPPAIRGDRDTLRQAIMNVLVNGVQFSQSGGRIMITWEAGAESLHVRIADSGPGIADTELARLGAPFLRGEQSSGLGLGLAVAKSLVELQGGELSIESEPGEGTTVTLSLVLARPEGLPDHGSEEDLTEERAEAEAESPDADGARADEAA